MQRGLILNELGKKMEKEMRMEVRKELGKELKMERGERRKECEEGDEDEGWGWRQGCR